jgi:hypothetical protein
MCAAMIYREASPVPSSYDHTRAVPSRSRSITFEEGLYEYRLPTTRYTVPCSSTMVLEGVLPHPSCSGSGSRYRHSLLGAPVCLPSFHKALHAARGRPHPHVTGLGPFMRLGLVGAPLPLPLGWAFGSGLFAITISESPGPVLQSRWQSEQRSVLVSAVTEERLRFRAIPCGYKNRKQDHAVLSMQMLDVDVSEYHV